MRVRGGGSEGRGFLDAEWPEEPSARYIYHWLFRKEKLCPGAQRCVDALTEESGGEPCLACPQVRLDEFLESGSGRALACAIGIDRNIQAGIQYGPQDLTYYEMLLLRLLCEEREKYTEELMEESSRKRR